MRPSLRPSKLATFLAILAALPLPALAGPSLPDPLFVTYWGVGSEQSLSSYCSLGYFNVINIAFVDMFGEIPFSLDTDGCSSTGSTDCSSIGSQIQSCQNAGVKILISLGGGTKSNCGDSGCVGNYYFTSASQAATTGTLFWNLFFGGSAPSGMTRPFGSVVLDGLDLDIEMTQKADGQSPQMYYDSFASTLKGYNSNLIISGAPECETTDNPMQGMVSSVPMDFLFVQFFNNQACSMRTAGYAAAAKYWAGIAAANSNGNTRLLMGVPGDPSASSSLDSSYYLSTTEALQAVANLRAQYPSANVGVGVWSAGSSVGSSASGGDPSWAETVAKGLQALPAASVASSSAASSSSAVKSSSSSSAASSASSSIATSASSLSILSASRTSGGTTTSGAAAAQTGTTSTSSSPAASSSRASAGYAVGVSANFVAALSALVVLVIGV